MAALTINAADPRKAVRFLEAQTITNQSGANVITKAVKVPGWAENVKFLLFVDSMAGTTPLLDFIIGIPDMGTEAKFAAPTDDVLQGISGWDGITQLTAAASAYIVEVDIGPHQVTDDTGSATAGSRYAVCSSLPPWLYYKVTLDGTTGDEDYTFRLVACFTGN